MYKKYIKRILDIVFSFIAIIILSPLFVALIIIGSIAMKGNPFFIQNRPGMEERIFKLIKFRTMDYKKDKNGDLLQDEDRLNNFGRFLRKTSLDELPEFFNIMKGDMSIIGPRPLLVQYLSRYNEEQHHRHDVRPGLSGYAQVHGRNAISWEEKFEMDIYYVRHVSFFFDLLIVFNTVATVARHNGINSATSETMEEFQGNHEKKDII